MPNSDPPAYCVDHVPHRRATITATLVGGVLGLLSCHGIRLAVFVYARAVLPEQSDAGDRFGVNLVILGTVGMVFLVSLVVMGLLTASLVHTYQCTRHHFRRSLIIVSFALTSFIMVIVPWAVNLLVELTIIALWVGLHAFVGSLAGDTGE